MATMSNFTDQQYLKTEQYKDASNLEARAAIHPRFSTNPYGWFNWLFDRLSLIPSKAKILELGCGNGLLWKSIADRIPDGWNITLSDLSPGMLDAAWRNLIVTGHAFKFQEIDAQSIPYSDGEFDVVMANHMLYHVPDRKKALKEIIRVLTVTGKLYATTVGDNHMFEMSEWRRRVTYDRYSVPFSASFTLENGAAQLSPFFRDVKLSRYEDSLQVTEVESIMAYLRSAVSRSDIDETQLKKLRIELEAVIAKDGAIFITKDSGLFEAVKQYKEPS
jgi:SAM-dependent methyltransferase